MSRPANPCVDPSFQFNVKPQNWNAIVRDRDEDLREIDVFAAEKYFSEDLYSDGDVFTGREGLSCGSTMSSRNSRSSLLNTTYSRSGKQGENRAAAVFNCSCTDKDYVDIADDHVADKMTKSADFDDVPKRRGKSQDRNMGWDHPTSNFLPVFSPSAGSQPYGGGTAIRTPLKIWSTIPEFGKMSMNLERKWVEEKVYYESDSDNSSDLFEIESISRGRPVFSDDLSGDKNCYPPSEGSVEWSVITASAVGDFCDIAADGYKKQSIIDHNSKTGRKLLLKSILFSACKSDKAVGVVENALRGGTKTSHRRLLPSSFRKLKVSDAGGTI